MLDRVILPREIEQGEGKVKELGVQVSSEVEVVLSIQPSGVELH